MQAGLPGGATGRQAGCPTLGKSVLLWPGLRSVSAARTRRKPQMLEPVFCHFPAFSCFRHLPR